MGNRGVDSSASAAVGEQLPDSTASPPSCLRLSEQQVATMDTVRDLSSALWSLRTSQEAARLLRTSLSLLRCFLFFDICYLIGGITLISMALSNQVKDQDNRMVFAGGLLTLFGSLSAMCNSLASHGLRTWRRAFLLPWLLFFPPRPRFPLPPPCPGVLPVPPEAQVGAPLPLPRHLLPLLLLAPHPQAVPRDGLPPAGAGRRRRRVSGP